MNNTQNAEDNTPSSTEKLQQRVSSLEEVVTTLRNQVQDLQSSQTIFSKAYRVSALWGDYVEFGAFSGDSLIQAYYAAHKVYKDMVGDDWNHSFADPDEGKTAFHHAWQNLRFIAFDSFEGMPESTGLDTVYPIFAKGTYACTEESFKNNLLHYGVDLNKVHTVKGFFQDTLTQQTANNLQLQRIGLVHIDSDLYESAKLALEFVTPYLMDGAIIAFDEWFQFMGNPQLGEQKAFQEWREAHPELLVTDFQKEGPFRNSFIISHRI